MASQYRVTQVHETSEWTSRFGPMLSHELSVENLTDGTSGFVQINSKPGKEYQVGETFFAETAGEFRGVLKLKRVQAPDGPPARGNGRAPAPAPIAAPVAPAAPKKAMPYKDALALVQKLAEDVKNDGLLIAVFRSIVDGSVENPMKPKATVHYFGKELETAGIEQAAWDEIDALCKELTQLTDEKHVKALLVSTCMVQSRKDLTAEKAKLFASALRANIRVTAQQRAVDVDYDGDPPF